MRWAGCRRTGLCGALLAAALAAPCGALGAAGAAPLRLAGHDAVDPAVRRFTAKVTRLGTPDRTGRVSTLLFEPLGPGMVPPKANEMRGWRLTFIRGKLFGRSLWLRSNTSDALTVRPGDPSMDGVVEGDVLMIELIDPKRLESNG